MIRLLLHGNSEHSNYAATVSNIVVVVVARRRSSASSLRAFETDGVPGGADCAFRGGGTFVETDESARRSAAKQMLFSSC